MRADRKAGVRRAGRTAARQGDRRPVVRAVDLELHGATRITRARSHHIYDGHEAHRLTKDCGICGRCHAGGGRGLVDNLGEEGRAAAAAQVVGVATVRNVNAMGAGAQGRRGEGGDTPFEIARADRHFVVIERDDACWHSRSWVHSGNSRGKGHGLAVHGGVGRGG